MKPSWLYNKDSKEQLALLKLCEVKKGCVCIVRETGNIVTYVNCK